MMKIGDFSLLTGLPVKTIRYYSDIGLISTASVDSESSYRYYGIKQLLEVKRISELKDAGFTLSEIKSISENEFSQKDMLRLLKAKLNLAIRERNQIEIKISNIEEKIKSSDAKEQEMKNEMQSAAVAGDEKKEILLSDVKVPPFNSTLMGMISGVADYYNAGLSRAMIYGLTGQAFMMNIHSELCTSGPYCWNRGPFYELSRNIGIKINDLGFYPLESSKEAREKLEEKLKTVIRGGNPCGLVNMEYQLITSYDDTRFVLSQPWGGSFPPGHLTYSNWDEFGNDVFANFFTFEKTGVKDMKPAVVKSLKYALDLNRNPASHTSEPYYTGTAAYDAFIRAVENGFGTSQGNWWNATVWGECRKMASEYFSEISYMFEAAAPLVLKLCKDYRLISAALIEVSQREMAAKPKIELLKEAKANEEAALGKVAKVLNMLETK